MSVPADVTLRLNGRFRVEDASGAPLTPRGTKAQGLLALLATSPARERSRPWLQQKLWSDRSREQGSASLRAALSEIRRTFGVHADVLRADRRVVALDDRAVCVVRDGAGEFLEGIDLRDPEFLDWLRAERRADLDVPTGETDAVPRPEPGVEIHISVQDDGTPMECLLSEVFLGRVANSLREELGISVAARDGALVPRRALTLRARTVAQAGTFALSASCYSAGGQSQIWTGMRLVEGRGAPPLDADPVLQMTVEAVAAIANALATPTLRRLGAPLPDDPGLLAATAVHHFFQLTKNSLAQADALFARAHEIEPRASHLAWRVLLRVVLLLERLATDPKAVKDELRELAAEALVMEPSSSVVLSHVAYAKLVVTSEIAEGMDCARRAVAINPANPFAWLTLSTSFLYSARPKEAHACMIRARRIGALSPYRIWWDTGTVLSATAVGDFDLAQGLADVATRLAPDFRPPLRYAIALNLRAGKFEEAAKAVQALRELEPSFAPEQLLEDAEYPSTILRLTQPVSRHALRDLGT